MAMVTHDLSHLRKAKSPARWAGIIEKIEDGDLVIIRHGLSIDFRRAMSKRKISLRSMNRGHTVTFRVIYSERKDLLTRIGKMPTSWLRVFVQSVERKQA